MVDWLARAFLIVVALGAGVNLQRGTLKPWVQSITLLDRGWTGLDAGGPSGAPGVTPSPGVVPPPSSSTPPGAGGGTYADPLPTGQLISPFGAPRDGGKRTHEGIDIAAPRGTAVVAIAAGKVARHGDAGRCGLRVAITHPGGVESIYCHLNGIAPLQTGQAIYPGSVVGWVGTTGNATGTTPHLHFEIRRAGKPVNPAPLIGR